MAETTHYRYRSLLVEKNDFGRIVKVDPDGLVDDNTVLNDAIKLAVEEGDHTLFHKGRSVYVRRFKYQPTTLAKALDEA